MPESDMNAAMPSTDTPLVSVIIPVYNHASFVMECIESVIAQDYANIELLIIDDGSSDDSFAVIESLLPACRERFVRFEFRSRPNKGLAATLNEALEWAKGEFFSALASDDVLLPNKTSRLTAEISGEQDIAGIFAGCEYINADGVLIGVETAALAYFDFEDVIRHRHFIQAATQLLRTDCLKQTGGYLEDLYIEDWYMWLKLTGAGYRLKNIPDVLARYRYHDANISKARLKMFEARKQILGHFRSHRLYPIGMSTMCIWAAIDFSCVSKTRSLGYLFQALAASPTSLFSRYFAKGVLRWLTPCFVVRHSEWLKARWPRLFAYLPGPF
jgi:alpha-1,3-rhamnosyltransferase